MAELSLKSNHIYLPGHVVKAVLGDTPNICLVYYPDKRSLLIARADDEVFKSLHKTRQYMLKAVSLNGDRSIAIHDLLIDNEVPGHARTLAHVAQAEMGILNVTL